MQPKDKAYIWDMLTAAEEISELIAGFSAGEFAADKRTRYAVERLLLVIGEAANHVSEEFQLERPAIPWRPIVGLRNIVAHEYGEVLVERVWNVAEASIPALVAELKSIHLE